MGVLFVTISLCFGNVRDGEGGGATTHIEQKKPLCSQLTPPIWQPDHLLHILTTRMLNKGAYSKKYQLLEKERLRHIREECLGAKRSGKERAHILSKQTAQRQKALEEKKRAMALAEEERRRRALEERRRTQKEATERFKSAISRLRSAPSKPKRGKGEEMNVEIYVSSNPAMTYPGAQKAVMKVWEGRTVNDRGRVAIGREVEITGYRRNDTSQGTQRKTPSLDDVLKSIRGGKKESDAVTSSEAAMPARGSTSDASLAVPIYQAKMVVPTPPIESSCPLGHPSEDQTCDIDSAEKTPSDTITDNTVFQPVTQRLSHHEQDSDDIQILSPDSATSPTDSLCESGSSTDLHDSLNHADVLGSSQRAEFEKQYIVRKPHRRTMSERGSQVVHVQVPGVVTGGSSVNKNAHPSSASQLQRMPQASTLYTDSDSSSSTDSLCHYSHHRPTPPRSRGRSRSTPGSACRGLSIGEQIQPQFNKELSQIKSGSVTENRIVGILKKPESSQQNSKVSSTTSTACASHMSSAAGSMLMPSGGTEISGKGTENEGGVRTMKRVRFVDQVQPSSGRAVPPTTTPLDAARTELWNRVLPNGLSAPFPPNSAFTPRMKVSLSPKSSLSVTGYTKPPSTPLNGLVVHVPRATVENSPSPECRSPEHGVAANSNLVRSNKSVSSSPVSHSHITDCPEEDQVSESSMQSEKDSTASSSTNKREDHMVDDQHGSSAGKHGGHKLNRIQRPIALEKTPTDDDINDLWDQIRRCLHTNEKITVPPQVFNFKLQPEDMPTSQPQNEGQRVFVTLPARQQPQLARKAGSVTHQKRVKASPCVQTGSPAHGQKQLVHRQSSRPLRCQHELHHPVQLWRRQNEAVHVRHQAAKDPDHGESATASSAGRKALTSLSLEEQRLLQSIEVLNQRLRDHQEPQSPLIVSNYHPPSPPSPSLPKGHHPPTTRVRGTSDLPKTRIRRHPKTVAMAAAVNAQALDSRTQIRIPTHRQPFYNT